MKIVPKNWRDFQHYKDRSPPWIRLHRKLLDNRDYNALPPIACKVMVLLWLLASESTDGAFEDNAEDLAFRLRLPSADVAQALASLMERGFFVPADRSEDDEEGVPLSKQIAARNGFGSRHIPDRVKREVWVRDDGQCCQCGSIDALEYDHIHPVSKGGGSDVDNIQLLCRTCNRRKRTASAEQPATPAQPVLGMRTTEAEAEAEAEAETEKRQREIPAAPAPTPSRRRKPLKTQLPDDFTVSERVRTWAASKGYGQLDEHLDAFIRKAKAKGYEYANWDDAFMEAIREDWAKLRGRGPNGAAPPPEIRAGPTDYELSQQRRQAQQLTPEQMAASAVEREKVKARMAGVIKRVEA